MSAIYYFEDNGRFPSDDALEQSPFSLMETVTTHDGNTTTTVTRFKPSVRNGSLILLGIILGIVLLMIYQSYKKEAYIIPGLFNN